MSDDARSGTFREVNERIADIAGTWEWEDKQGFLCECVRRECTRAVLLTRGEYERVRAGGARFFTAPGHEQAEQERVVERHVGFVVVEKLGVYQQEAEREDPRRSTGRAGTGGTIA
jgi:hypothetical protein